MRLIITTLAHCNLLSLKKKKLDYEINMLSPCVSYSTLEPDLSKLGTKFKALKATPESYVLVSYDH
jgi:hypothetical protein